MVKRSFSVSPAAVIVMFLLCQCCMMVSLEMAGDSKPFSTILQDGGRCRGGGSVVVTPVIDKLVHAQQDSLPAASAEMTTDELRAQAAQILSSVNLTCDDYDKLYSSSSNNKTTQIFYNRIGKAGSSTLMKLLQRSILKRARVSTTAPSILPVKLQSALLPSDRGSDEYMTRQGELELIQKIVGNPQINWMNQQSSSSNGTNHTHEESSEARGIFVYHTFFLNFTRYNLETPIYINLVRDPATRYASQFAFWKTLPDIGKLTQEHGATLDVCLRGQYIGCPPLNYQTSYFCGHEEACHDPPNDATFLQAVRHAVENYALIGTLERLEDFRRIFAHLFPTWLNPKRLPAWQNPTSHVKAVNKNPLKHVSSSDELRQVREANRYDVLLYEVIDKMLDQWMDVCGEKKEDDKSQ